MATSDIVFCSAIAFLFGIFAASINWSIPILLLTVLVLGLGFLFLSHKLEFYKPFLILVFTIFLGAFYYNLYLNLEERSQNIKLNSQITFSGTISDEPVLSEKFLSFTLNLSPPFSGEIRVLTNPLDNFHYGDFLNVEGKIIPANAIGQKSASFSPKIQLLAQHRGFWLREKLLVLKNNLTSQFEKVLSADEAALLAGITFGTRSNFSGEFKKQMVLSGTTHLVALSGYNISILVFAIAWAFGQFLSRRKTFYLTVATIILFVLMVGAEASVVRAAIMGFLALLAKEIGRIYSMRNSIALTALTMVIINPTILAFNPGFQLSFASLLGIVYLGPALKNIFEFGGGGFTDWRENAITTISAQLAVIPLLIQNFGQYSLTAILANILILGFIPLTMALGFLLAALGMLSIYLGFLVAQLVKVLLFYEIAVIKFFAKISFILPLTNSVATTAIYYIIVFLVIYNFYPHDEKI